LVLVPPCLPLRVVCPRRLPPSLHSPSSPRPLPRSALSASSSSSPGVCTLCL
jgi:hypothetical protein